MVIRTEDPSSPVVTDVRNAAVIDDFYGGSDTTEDPAPALEQAFALTDQAARQPLARMAKSEPFPPSRNDRPTIALWLAALNVRGPRRARRPDTGDAPDTTDVVDRPTAAAALGRLGRGLGEGDAGDSEAADFAFLAQHPEVWDSDAADAKLGALALEAALRLEPFFTGRFWTLLRFPEPGLVTCDRPIKLFKAGAKWADTGVGVATADEVWLPLDRSTALIMHANKLVGEKATDTPANFTVDSFNQEIISNSHREIYCHEADFERVAQLQLAPSRKT